MRTRTAFAIITALAVSGLASAQAPLTIGDKAPAFKVAGTVKGDKISALEKGKTYVIEFWATWCGPCIASMPHLSEMADAYKGKIDFVSVNTWDYAKNADKVAESSETHVTRVNDWVAKNTDKMRYNIVLDDEKDTISTTWMRAAGRNGIPCAFIVNDEGKIAWIGHPMSMEPVLKAVESKTWDLAAFKEKFDKEAAVAREAAEKQKKLAISVKAGDMAAVEAYLDEAKGGKQNELINVVNAGITANPELVLQVITKYQPKVTGLPDVTWLSIASALAPKLSTPDSKASIVKFSEARTANIDAKIAAQAYMLHAKTLAATGDKDGASQWIEKARAALETYEPAARKEAMAKQIDDFAKSLKS